MLMGMDELCWFPLTVCSEPANTDKIPWLHADTRRAIVHHPKIRCATNHVRRLGTCDHRFVGVQSVLIRVPPNDFRSMIATFIPAPARGTARGRDEPDWFR